MRKVGNVTLTTLGLLSAASLVSSCSSTPPTGPTSPIDGTWTLPCVPPAATENFNGHVGGVSLALVFDGGNYTYTQSFFADSSCVTAAISIAQTGTFAIGAEITTPTGATELLFTQSAVTGTPASAAFASTLNSGHICGSSISFSAGSASDLSGATCGTTGTAQLTNGTGIAQIYYLNTSVVPNRLELGIPGGGLSNLGDPYTAGGTPTYPSAFNTTNVWIF